ncbi:type 1 glutamine amidotransferase [Hoyosella sp. G463]|uniref:Type 1 glutamine amidotransferase n=1 Tax=Lolliginicoccus lacisalsi TaxID=2742202 RepID=A0A927JE82_9ACTN|nr:type 1 glutamine amidotransferase [Lolliginicoccus lacisalsi]MBD8507644.1 type 1 glutamine amidotransferase [Lolliginicoccus lacisalsi]
MARIVITVIENHPNCPLDLLEEPLRQCHLEIVRPYYGDAIPAASDVGDGMIVLGGYQNAQADDDCPWLPRLRALMAACVDEAIPLLGICLGAQLLALACGGRLDRDAKAGLEAGVAAVQWSASAASDPLFRRIAASCDPLLAPTMHFDAISELPPGATLLGSSVLYQNQAFRVGDRAWGVQFHPEASYGAFRAWATDAAMQESISPSRFLEQYLEREPQIEATARMVGSSFRSVVLAASA